MITLTERARALLAGGRPGQVLVFAWHPLAVCCAAAGEVALSAVPRSSVTASRHQLLPAKPTGSVFAARAAYPHLVDRDIVIDARRRFGMTTYSSDLPGDFGLRVSFGRAPATHAQDSPTSPAASPQPRQGA